MKSLFYYIMVVAVVVAVVAPFAWAEQAEEPDSLLNQMEGGNSKPFNLQGANSQRRAHGIYFNGR